MTHLITQSKIIFTSYSRLLNTPLIIPQEGITLAEALYNAPFALLSHGTEADPIFNYANKCSQKLFELNWQDFIRTPSRKSADLTDRAERDRLLERVQKFGYIDDYCGVRITSTGRKFEIRNALVWNLTDAEGQYRGQAAMFSQWRFLEINP